MKGSHVIMRGIKNHLRSERQETPAEALIHVVPLEVHVCFNSSVYCNNGIWSLATHQEMCTAAVSGTQNRYR